jgi:hypothetical protein
MAPKKVFSAVLCATLLVWGGLSFAQQYRPDEFLGLDLSRAVLSKKLLGPPTEFAPVAVEARSDRASERVQGRVEPKAVAKITVAETHVAHTRGEKPRGAAHTRLVRRHGNPLEARAQDTRIQVWPCRSSGICNWQRHAN